MRVCDLIADFIYQQGVKHIFTVTGGGSMYLTDGLACNSKMHTICCHHEQAAAMAVVGYAKYHGFGCGYVTTGCGGTNTITGVLHAWQDNTACIFISGQCKRKETIRYTGAPIRQFGVQEADIVRIVESITKYAVMIDEPSTVLFHLEKAVYLARSGRPGPVWLDIPLDIQSAEVSPEKLTHFDPNTLHAEKVKATPKEIAELCRDFLQAKRPIVIAGQGIRLAGAIEEFDHFVHQHQIPFVCSRLGTDVLPTMDDLNIGRIGNKGMRSANFALQNADFVLALGSRLSVSSTGQEYQYFAREAKVVVVDIDKYEHTKNTVHIESVIVADVKDVLSKLSLDGISYQEWAAQCLNWKQQYPVCLPEYYEASDGINLYVFVNELSKILKPDSVLMGDAGSAVYVPPQALQTYSKDQRYITSGAQAEMGFSLPGAIGVCVARGGREVFSITGDGSLQMNIQELQTLRHYNLPVKLFVWNNDGYMSIRATQNKFFQGRLIGTDSSSGVSFPDLKKLADAYGIRYFLLEDIGKLPRQLEEIAALDEPAICELICIRDQEIIPTVSSKQTEDGRLVSMPLEDMYPFLDREELESNMFIPLIEKP